MAKSAPAKTKQNVKDETPKSWQNRVVGTGEEAPDQLLANPKNWRIHPKAQQDGLEAVLDRVGWVQSVVVNRRTGFLVDGHLRVTLAMRRGEAKVPVVYVDLTAEEEDLVLATMDPLAGLAATDRDQLAALLDAAHQEDPTLQALLDSISQHEGLSVPPPPSLDELVEQHGDHDPETFWPVLKLKLPPEVFERYESTLRGMPGGDDAAKFAALLDRVSLV